MSISYHPLYSLSVTEVLKAHLLSFPLLGMTLGNAYSTSPLNSQYSQQPVRQKAEPQTGSNSTGSPTEDSFSPQQSLSPKGASTNAARFTGSQVGVREMRKDCWFSLCIIEKKTSLTMFCFLGYVPHKTPHYHNSFLWHTQVSTYTGNPNSFAVAQATY